MNVAQETLDFRWTTFSVVLSLLMPTSAFPFTPACITAHLLSPIARRDPVDRDRRMECSPTTTRLAASTFTASVQGLVPRIIDAESLD